MHAYLGRILNAFIRGDYLEYSKKAMDDSHKIDLVKYRKFGGYGLLGCYGYNEKCRHIVSTLYTFIIQLF